MPAVREALNGVFRERLAAADPGIVVEGRDITTVVAPDAQVRILLTAERRGARGAPRRQLPDLPPRDRGAGDRGARREGLSGRRLPEAADGVTTLDSTDLDFDQTVEAVLVGLVLERVPR